MANPEHLKKLDEGVKAWNGWMLESLNLKPDLSGTDLSGADLYSADLRGVDLSEAILRGANLFGSNLRRANLIRAKLPGANLIRANLSATKLTEADLRGANLTGADLSDAILSLADLTGASLSRALLLHTELERATLSECRIYGVSVWDAKLDGAAQHNLVITPDDQPKIEVDDLEIAQFIYLLLNNQKIRDVIDTMTSKVVLILGRFTPERKVVLEAIRAELRKRNLLPVLFDFQKPTSQTTAETIETLAHMARFFVADLTDAKSVLQELSSIVPNSPSVVVQPLLLAIQEEPGMFDFFRRFPWVLEPVRYSDQAALMASLDATVIAPAEAKAKALTAGP
jgi:hypothetical protein